MQIKVGNSSSQICNLSELSCGNSVEYIILTKSKQGFCFNNITIFLNKKLEVLNSSLM